MRAATPAVKEQDDGTCLYDAADELEDAACALLLAFTADAEDETVGTILQEFMYRGPAEASQPHATFIAAGLARAVGNMTKTDAIGLTLDLWDVPR
jgi:hypothetical protein